jgi:hypothetical protein
MNIFKAVCPSGAVNTLYPELLRILANKDSRVGSSSAISIVAVCRTLPFMGVTLCTAVSNAPDIGQISLNTS